MMRVNHSKDVEHANERPSPSESTPLICQGAASLNSTVICTSLLASLGGFLFGFDIGYIGPILEFPGFRNSINSGQEFTSHEKGAIVGIFSLGAVLSAFPLVSAYFSDGFGRRKTILLGAAVFCVGAAIQAAAGSINDILLGRFISGLSIGLLSSTVPLYQSEIAPSEWRGLLGATYQWAITWGILISFLMDEAADQQTSIGWRAILVVQLIPGGVLIVGMLWAPHSPRWLMLVGRESEARQTLVRIRFDDGIAEQELAEIERSLQQCDDSSPMQTFRLLFCDKYNRRLLLVGVAIMMLSQLCGMNAFMYYGVIIFGSLGLPAYTLNTAIGLVNVLSTVPGMYAMDRHGRKKLLSLSGGSMLAACCVTAVGGSISGSSETLQSAADAVVVVAAIFFVFSFAYGWGPVSWVYCAEIFPLQIRSSAVGTTTCFCWIGNFLIAQFTPYLFEEFKFMTFGIFAIFCALALLLARWMPETKGTTLEDMPKLFEPKLHCKSNATTEPLQLESVSARDLPHEQEVLMEDVKMM